MALLKQNHEDVEVCDVEKLSTKKHEYTRQGTAIEGDVVAHAKIFQPCRHAF